MKVKIFQSINGVLNGKLGSSPINLEDAINDFLKHNKIGKNIQITQSQSSVYVNGRAESYELTNIFY